MKKQHRLAIERFEQSLKDKDKVVAKKFMQQYWSINDHNFILPILQEVIDDWKVFDGEGWE